MTIQFDEGKPSPEEFLHSGVKGMRWGHRKADASTPLTVSKGRTNRAPTKDEILNARQVQKQRQAGIKALDNKHGKYEDDPKHYKLTKEHEKAYEQLLESDERVIAKYKTRGEQIVATLLLGPAGAIVISNRPSRIRSRLENQRA